MQERLRSLPVSGMRPDGLVWRRALDAVLRVSVVGILSAPILGTAWNGCEASIQRLAEMERRAKKSTSLDGEVVARAKRRAAADG